MLNNIYNCSFKNWLRATEWLGIYSITRGASRKSEACNCSNARLNTCFMLLYFSFIYPFWYHNVLTYAPHVRGAKHQAFTHKWWWRRQKILRKIVFTELSLEPMNFEIDGIISINRAYIFLNENLAYIYIHNF